jgi:hypothetical protein
MRASVTDSRVVWLVGGLMAGLGVAYFWPHEPAYATTADRDSNFALITIPVGTSAAGITDAMDGVFILDFLTGQLKGAVLNRQSGKFASFYYRDLAKDFNVDPQAAPHYALASGYAQVSGQLGKTFASGVLYVAELSSGVLAAYSFPWNEAPRAAPITYEMHLLHHFPWRQPTKKDK